MKDRIFSGRTTLLFAGSGVGKTSFLNAKVMPELKSQFSVVYHNRWTGVDEQEDEDLNERPPLKRWPPSGFFHSLRETWHWWRSRRNQPAKPAPQQEPMDEGKLVADVRRVITQSLQSDSKSELLSSVLEPFRTKKGSLPAAETQRCLLILDQFEEVFQYHAYQDYFAAFIADLCEIINDDDCHVRVVFSMREEFLGELSVFDNRITDLFNNYYRLRSPEKEEAKDIITFTCKPVEVDEKKLDLFVDDLSKVEQGFEDQDGTPSPRTRFVRRNFVPPPYLQIACEKLWTEQYTPVTDTNGKAVPKPTNFLANYKTASEDGTTVPESDAQRAVRTFCESKLNRKFLTSRERWMVARAFDFLVTGQGAKMAYELKSLASHMEVAVFPLRTVLQKLSSHEARILRESRGTQRSYWYELYHDMYAGVIERWKLAYHKEKRRRERVRLLLYTSILAVVLGVSYFGFRLVYRPYVYKSALDRYSASIGPDYDLIYDGAFYAAYSSFERLQGTWGYGSTARSRWAEILEKRARLHMRREERDQALISLLQAADLSGDPEKPYLPLANNLFSKSEESIESTYCVDCIAADLSPDGRSVAAIARDKKLYVFSASEPSLRKATGDTAEQAIFSADSNSLAYVAPVYADQSRQGPAPQPGANTGRQATDLPRLPASRSEAAAVKEANVTAAPSPSPVTDTWEIRIKPIPADSEARVSGSSSDSAYVFQIKLPLPKNRRAVADDESPEFKLLALSQTPMGYLVAGIGGDSVGHLSVWSQNGSEILRAVVADWRFIDTSYAATFSKDGKYLALGSGNQPLRVWTITQQELKLKNINGVLASKPFSLSPNGKYLVGSNKNNVIEVWDLAGEKKLFALPPPTEPWRQIGFGESDGRFFIEGFDNTMEIWDVETKKPISAKIPPDSFAHDLFTDSALKNAVRWGGGGRFRNHSFQMWSLESGNQLGELKVSGEIESASLDSQGNTVLLLDDSVVRSWRIPGLAENTDSEFSRKDVSNVTLSPDGHVMRTFKPAPKGQFPQLQFWNADNLSPLFSFSPSSPLFVTSYDGSHLAQLVSNGVEIYERGKSEPVARIAIKEKVKAIQFSRNDKLMIVDTDAEIHLVDTASFKETGSLKTEAKSRYFRERTVSPSGNFLLVQVPDPFGDDPTPKNAVSFEVWSLSSLKKLKLQTELAAFQGQTELSSNDRLLTADKGKAQIWDLRNDAKIAEFSYEPSARLAFSDNGELVVIAEPSGRLQLWQVASQLLVSQIKLGTGAIELWFSSDNAHLCVVTGSWIHYLAVGPAGFSYINGVVSGTLQRGSLRQLNPEGKTIRWLERTSHDVVVRTVSFSGSKNSNHQNPGEMLNAWRKRLGLSIKDGMISRVTP